MISQSPCAPRSLSPGRHKPIWRHPKNCFARGSFDISSRIRQSGAVTYPVAVFSTTSQPIPAFRSPDQPYCRSCSRARAQAVASLHGPDGRSSTQAYFAYGLASSFEAYADTRRNRITALDDLGQVKCEPIELPSQLRWYIDRIAEALPDDTAEGWAAHPKVAATVGRVLDLWRSGEKALVFCFYVETGRALRSHISRELRSEIVMRAAHALDMDPANDADVLAELDKIGERLLRSDARGYEAFRQRVRELTAELDEVMSEQTAEIAVRFMRTPSFLVRFVDLSRDISVDGLLAGLEYSDGSGITFAQRIGTFARALAQKVEVERNELLAALNGIQTGGIATTADDFSTFGTLPAPGSSASKCAAGQWRSATGHTASVAAHVQYAVLPRSPGRQLSNG